MTERSLDEQVDAYLERTGGSAPGGEFIIEPVESFDVPWEASSSSKLGQALRDAFYQKLEERGLGRRPAEADEGP